MVLPTERLLTVKDLVEQLPYEERTIRKILKDGKIKGSNPTGRKWLVRSEDLDDFLKSNSPTVDTPPPSKDSIRLILGRLIEVMWLPTVADMPMVALTGKREFRTAEIHGRTFNWIEAAKPVDRRRHERRKTVERCWLTDDQDRWLLSVFQGFPEFMKAGITERYRALQSSAAEYIDRAFEYKASFAEPRGWWSIEQIEDAIRSGQGVDGNADAEPGMWLLDEEPLVLGRLENFKQDLLL
ncbi:MAG: helix-turn-helix domain-containing protein [Chloroflexi bacterium]|nr:helix-turn-helix domain-containing protein [Chloroflexota bacterium]